MKNFISFSTLFFIVFKSIAQLPPGAVGYYKLNGNGADSSGLGNHGTIVGTVIPADDRFSNPSSAMFFDGTSGHINIGNDPDFQITDSLTIAAWIQPLQSLEWSGIASKWSNTGGYYLGINPITNSPRINLGNPNFIEGNVLTYGNWIHIAATFDGSIVRIYEDGIETNSMTIPQTISNTTASFILGTQDNLQTNKFLGSMDDVVVYARTLNQAEIQQLMNQCIPPSLTTTVTNVPCNGGTGTATVNATGNAPFNYLWSNGQTTQTATGLTVGSHSVTVFDDSSCVATASVNILQPAAVGITISSTPTNSVAPNCDGSVSATPFGGTPPYTAVWSSGTTTNLCEGWYTVTITDANNCVKTDSVYVNFVTGIEELNAAGISVYPNPVNDVLTITSLKEIGEVKIYDGVGKLILTEKTQQKNFNFNITQLNNGIYLLEINGQQIKLVKQ